MRQGSVFLGRSGTLWRSLAVKMSLSLWLLSKSKKSWHEANNQKE